MRVMVKECVWQRVGDDVVVVHDPREALTLADPNGDVEALLAALNAGPATVEDLIRRLRADRRRLTEADVTAGLDGLDGLGLLEYTEDRTLDDAALAERQFSNLEFFGAYARRDRSRAGYVRRIGDAHVLVLGVGGGGSSIVQCLAGLGVGTLTLVDRDDVAPRNFARQFLYRHRDIGRSKVERAAEWVREYDPDITVRPVDRWIAGPDDLVDLIDGVDVVVGGLDGVPGANVWVNDVAVGAGIPFVGGGMGRTQFMYCSVDPGISPCLRCDESDRPAPGDPAAVAYRLSDRLRLANALIGSIAMQIGSLIALEATRYLSGFEPPRAAGARVTVDLRTGLLPEWERFPRDPDCPTCAHARRVLADRVAHAEPVSEVAGNAHPAPAAAVRPGTEATHADTARAGRP